MFRALAGRFFLSAAFLAPMAACSGGSSVPPPTKVVQPTPSAQPSQVASETASATFTIVVPATAKSATARRPNYISTATKSIKLASTALLPSSPVILNVANSGTGPGTGSGTSTSGSCTETPPTTGPFTCTMHVNLVVGSDSITLSTFDASGATGNLLSQQSATVTVLEGIANGPSDGQSNASEFAIVLDANAAVMTVSATAACQAGPVGTAIATVATAPVSFTVAYADLATKTVTAPGLPTLAVTSSGLSGGTIGITINQAAQTFTLTPSATGVSGTVTVKATPPNASDNLSFSLTKSFTFSSGGTEPASFLAVPEQGGTSPGQLNLYTIVVGVGSGSPDSLFAASPATLSDVNNDVDNPQAVAFDASGNLLIANGGTTVGGDTGNVACVPAGAITTAATTSTDVTTFADDPDSIAYGTDGSIAIANEAGGAAEALATYVLSGDYVAAPTSRDVAGNGAISVAALASGAYAVSLPTLNKVDIETSGGATIPITNATNIVSPESLAWDPANSQLAVNNNPSDPTTTNAYVSFFTQAGAFVNHVLLTDPSDGNQYTGAQNPGTLAASADGHIAAVAYDCSGYEAVFVFGNTPARSLIGLIPFNTTMVADGGTDLIYGGNANVRSLTWLSNTKLLVALESTGSSTSIPDSHEGLYIFDISASATPAGFNDCTADAATAGPKQTGFLHTTLPPLATAYKP
jgi:hypothetical protein